MDNLRFLCEDCGGPIRIYDGRNYRAPETQYEPPLRYIIGQQRKTAGRALCRTCCEKFLKTTGQDSPELRERIMP